MWFALALSTVLASNPPLVAAPDVPPPPPVDFTLPPPPPSTQPAPGALIDRAKPKPPPLPPARLALYFAPVSLFSLTLWLEADLHLAAGVSVFGNVGGGPLGQLGGDAGFRYYIGGAPFEGFALDAHASVFSLPSFGLVMAGPGLQLLHAWRVGRLALSIGLGFTTWYRVSGATFFGQQFFGATPSDADVIVFAGISQPPADHPGVQPTIRVSLGPWF